MIISGTVTHNEKYILNAIGSLKQFADIMVIVDDGSPLEYYDFLNTFKEADNRIKLYRIEKTRTEYERRNYLWERIKEFAEEGSWIVILDADEKIADEDISKLKKILKENENNYRIETIDIILYNLWSWTEYRTDGYWHPKHGLKKRIFKFKDTLPFEPLKWKEGLSECGEVPSAVYGMSGIQTDIKLLHLGYILPEDRRRKYEFHKKADPEGKFHISSHVESIIQETQLAKL